MNEHAQPKYLSELNAFHRWLDAHYLPASAQLLWFRLIDLCNRCGWTQWMQIDTMRLTSMASVSSQNAALRARDALVEAGLLRFEAGRKGQPTRYRLVYFLYDNHSENARENAQETQEQTDGINKQETDQTKQDKKITVPAELAEVFGAYAQMRAKMRKTLTEPAAQLVLRTLEQLAPDNPQTQRQILEQSIVNGWAGVYPLKRQQEAPRPPASYDIEELERRLLYGKIEYKKRE